MTAYRPTLSRVAVIALGFSIPVSTAADNALLALVACCFVAGGGYRARWLALRANPVSIAALALFAALAMAAFYAPSAAADAGRYLLRYADLLFIPVIAAFFHDAATRRTGLYAFAAAITMTLIFSAALHAGVVARSPMFIYNTVYPVVFKHNLTHTILMAFGAFLFAQLATAGTGRARWLWSGLAACALMNMVFLVPGGTGYVVLGPLALYLGYTWWRWRGITIMVAATAAAVIIAYQGSFLVQQRVDRALAEYSSWQPGTAANSSVGLRLEFYRNSVAIVRDHPVAGVGTGGFPQAYERKVSGTSMMPTDNPHNEYLLVAVQTGIIGLLLLIHLFGQQWRLAPRLASPLETHVARGLVLTVATGCLFNSLLLDHTEGLLFAWLTGLLYSGLQSKSVMGHAS